MLDGRLPEVMGLPTMEELLGALVVDSALSLDAEPLLLMLDTLLELISDAGIELELILGT